MQLDHTKQILLYNQRSRPLVVRRENAALPHAAVFRLQLVITSLISEEDSVFFVSLSCSSSDVCVLLCNFRPPEGNKYKSAKLK